MKFKIIIHILNSSIFVLALDADTDLQQNILKSGYSINNKCEEQLSHSIDRSHVVIKFQLPKLNDITMIFRKMLFDCNNSDHLSPLNSKNYGHM